MKIPMRIQFFTSDAGLQEVVVESYDIALQTSAKYARRKLMRGQSAGDTFIRRADLPRLIPTKVGE